MVRIEYQAKDQAAVLTQREAFHLPDLFWQRCQRFGEGVYHFVLRNGAIADDQGIGSVCIHAKVR